MGRRAKFAGHRMYLKVCNDKISVLAVRQRSTFNGFYVFVVYNGCVPKRELAIEMSKIVDRNVIILVTRCGIT